MCHRLLGEYLYTKINDDSALNPTSYIGLVQNVTLAGRVCLTQCNARIEIKLILVFEHCVKHPLPARIIP